MNMIFKTISGVLLILFLANGVLFAGNELTVPVDGEQLYNVLFTVQKQNQDGENMLIQALSKIHVNDVLKVTPVNFKGERGANVQPDMVIKGDDVILSLGALLEFDLDKYKKSVVDPLQEVLKKVSPRGGERVTSDNHKIYKMQWKYGNQPYMSNLPYMSLGNDWRFSNYYGKGFIILNVMPTESNIFSSTYEAYKVNMTSNLKRVFQQKLNEANGFSVHFVFKDDMGQEVFHEIFKDITKNKISKMAFSVKDNMNMATGIYELDRYGAKSALFYVISKSGSYDLPIVISPEIQVRGGSSDDKFTNNSLAICVFKAKASEVAKIKSYEIYIEEAAQEER